MTMIKRFIILVFLVAVISNCGAENHMDGDSTPAKLKTYIKAKEHLQSNDEIRLIVGFDSAETKLSNKLQEKINQNAEVSEQNELRGKLLEEHRVKLEKKRKDVYSRHFIKENQVHAEYQFSPYFVVNVDLPLLEKLAQSSEISSLEFDHRLRPNLDASIPLINADDSWTHWNGYTGSGYAVAVLDTGVDKTHDTFSGGKVVSEACYSLEAAGFASFCPGSTGQSTASGSGVHCSLAKCDHGTHVAGIAAGNGALGIGLDEGVAPGADIVAIQVFTEDLSTNEITAFTSDIMLGLDRVLELSTSMDIAAANLSLGDPQNHFASACDANYPSMTDAIDNLRAVSIPTVISAGNEFQSTQLSFPACISSAVSVGSVDDYDGISWFSNRASYLSVLAPGGDGYENLGLPGGAIFSSIPGNGAAEKSGTSMAAPHIAGAFAIWKEAVSAVNSRPNRTVSEYISLMQSTGVTVTDSSTSLDYKRVDVYAVLDRVLQVDMPVEFVAWGQGSSSISINSTIDVLMLGESPESDISTSFFSVTSGWTTSIANVAFGSSIDWTFTSAVPTNFKCTEADSSNLETDSGVVATCYPPEEAQAATTPVLY